jgi:hypothetical protein
MKTRTMTVRQMKNRIQSINKGEPQRMSEMMKNPLRNLSRHQYGTLRFIAQNHVTIEYLRNAHANTLGSIAYNGWIVKKGTGEKAEVVLTKSGEEELRTYNEASLNERQHEGELTDRCMRLLAHSRSKVASIAS